MKTIVRLITFAALMVMPFVAPAQENVQDTVKKKTVYIDEDVAWLRHKVGKTMEDPESKIEGDSVKWIENYNLSFTSVYRVYAVVRGNHAGKYIQYFKKDECEPDYKAVLVRTKYIDELNFQDIQILTGRIPNEDYYLKQAGVRKELSPSEKVWLKFWEVHLKNEAKKSK